MKAAAIVRDALFHEMESGIRSTKHLLGKVKSEDWNYSPAGNMRTLKQLVSHLVSIPEVDLGILQEKKHEEIMELENKYNLLDNTDNMAAAMDKGYKALHTYMTFLSDEDFLWKKTKAFYLEYGSTQVQWLTEIVTHLFHHRAQLFTYLKQLGYEVSMEDLYI